MDTCLLAAAAGSELTTSEVAKRLLFALVLGAAIGLERAFRDKPAGFRTNILISLGACAFTLLSQTLGGPEGESTRIAAQVVTGVGFLGAGAILRDARHVVGLTTAATIWAVAAVGMAAGFGQYTVAVLAAACIVLVLLVFSAIGRRIDNLSGTRSYRLTAPNTQGQVARLEQRFKQAGLRIVFTRCAQEGDDVVLSIRARGSATRHDRLRDELLTLDDCHVSKG